MKPRRLALVSTALLGVGLMACAAAPPAPQPAPEVADGWSDLSFEAKHARMTFVVHPALARRFKKADDQKVAKLTCQSCHGERAEEVRYRMPAIEALSPARVAQIYEPGAELSPLLRFMRDVVTPTTARLMRVPAYNPKTGRGLGCFSCHLKEKE